jgi:ABC-type spermidine/putrescine transport system permease subunit II
MGLGVAAVWRGWLALAGSSTLSLLIGLGVAVVAGVTAYVAGIWMLRLEGREDLAALVRRRAGRSGS